MRLGADGPVGHRTGGEPLEDLRHGLDLVDRNRRAQSLAQREQAAQGGAAPRQLVDGGGVLPEHLVLTTARGVLEQEDRLRVEQVHLTLAAPLVFTAGVQVAVGELRGDHRVRLVVTGRDLVRDDVDAHTVQPGRRPGEVGAHQLLGQADRLEHLGSGVAGHGGDAHLAHHLEHALAQRLDEVLLGLLTGDAGQLAAIEDVVDRLEGQVGVDSGRTVSEKQGDMVDLACVTALHDETDLGAGLLPDEVVVDGRGEQQRGNRRLVPIGIAVGQDDDAGTVRDRLADATADLVEPLGERRSAAVHIVEATDSHRREPRHVTVVVDTNDLGKLRVADNRERQVHQPARRR